MSAADALDRIEITNLVVDTVVGALALEREQPQPVRVDLVLAERWRVSDRWVFRIAAAGEALWRPSSSVRRQDSVSLD